ncbi:MAG: hypothetical protein CMO80_23855 [Verrucomicrobiales bacterium]|nr:hypothetical protein [Verrucomicrobiales bacterium]|tara:strand:- start:9671 stop:11680 length:2010 start_codon:yes stop_codon:yes gene_type:complete
MNIRFSSCILAILIQCSASFSILSAEGLIPVGVAKVDVTPKEPVVLAGYGSRKTEFESIDTKLWARAMVFGDKQPIAIVALDNCGVPMSVTLRLAARLRNHGIERERLVVAATHTHNAPNLPGNAPLLWAGRTTPEMDRRSSDYTTFAIEQMEAAVVAALENRRPRRLEWAKGRASFGGNRRLLKNGRWVGFGFQRNGPVDHSVPVLAARDADGTVRAIWANYACHCTTLGSRNAINGDWAGYASAAIERDFTNAVSLITIGCGADVGPQPSGQLEYSKRHGEELAEEVRRLLNRPTTALREVPSVASKQLKLPLEEPASREEWEVRARKSGFSGQLAKAMLARLGTEGRIPDQVDYPLTAWTFGDDLAMVFLAGEVVVDYAVRLNRELDWTRLWYHAWANDMPSYIPSRRVLSEGGYEPGSSQIYYAKPGPYKPEIEDLLVNAVRELLGPKFAARPNQIPAPYHRIPGAPESYDPVEDWIPRIPSELSAQDRSHFHRLVQSALPGVEKITAGEAVEWRNYMGYHTPRHFLRQLKGSRPVAWSSPMITTPDRPVVLCFSGGLGWKSQPAAGFELSVGGQTKVVFEVTTKPGRWSSADNSAELAYLPNWRNSQDSGGFFFVKLNDPRFDKQGRLTFTVRSLGQTSRRWFAIDMNQNVKPPLKKLKAALAE